MSQAQLRRTPQVFAICNQKGGVGKSTTCFHLIREAVRKGLRVLAIDADPQGNLTSAITADEVAPDQAGLADAISGRAPETLADVIVPGLWAGLDVVPTSGETLGAVRDELVVMGAGREGRLREAIASIADRYDVVFIDCAPSLDQLTINALTAAHGAVIVTQSKKWSLDGLAHLLETITRVQTYYNPGLVVSGIIVNHHEGTTIGAATWLKELRAAATEMGLPLLDPAIPKRVVVADTVEASRGLDEWGNDEATSLSRVYRKHLESLEGALL